MKYQVFLAFCVVILVATIKAQRRCLRCPQGICDPSCTGEPNVGNNCTTAPPRRMWYFDRNNRTCRPLAHLGCGGNNNRWCSFFVCTIRCSLRIN